MPYRFITFKNHVRAYLISHNIKVLVLQLGFIHLNMQ
jgi:hypothetical protein